MAGKTSFPLRSVFAHFDDGGRIWNKVETTKEEAEEDSTAALIWAEMGPNGTGGKAELAIPLGPVTNLEIAWDRQAPTTCA